MKRISLILASTFLLANMTRAQKKEYRINSDIKNQSGYSVKAYLLEGTKQHVDSPAVVNGDHIQFRGSFQGPTFGFLISNHPSSKFELVKGGMFMPSPRLQFFVEDAPITIKGNADELFMARVTGGKLNKEYNKLKKKTLPLIKENWELRKKSAKMPLSDSLKRKAIMKEMKDNSDKIDRHEKQFIKSHPNSYVSVLILSGKYEEYSLADYERAYNHLSDEMKATAMAETIHEKIEGTKNTAIGFKAPNFTKPTPGGDMLSLNSLKGKYVLIDFWGSWCGPCRAGNPHLKDLYAKYKSKGFEIVGIANEKSDELDAAKTSWLKAVKDDGLPWLHVLNNYNKDKDNLVAKFAVTGFPTKILVDRSGTIIYKEVGTGGDGLDKELEKIFGM